jgi:hypothetical protein
LEFEQKDGVSTTRSARKSSRNILGWNRKQELDLNYNGGIGAMKKILTKEPKLKKRK